MRGINFINSLSPKQQYALARWYTFSVICLLGTILVITVLQIQQLYCLHQAHCTQQSLQQKLNIHSPAIKNLEALRKQEESLTQKEATLKTLAHYQHTLIKYFTAIISVLTTQDSLSSITLDKTSLHLVINCTNSASALKIAQHLQGLPHFADIHLVSLQPCTVLGKQFIASITGTLKNTDAL